ncbi:MAG: hypothetical protein KKB31_04340 [Nanoarchaeota archaeon]|nr:hypothetical protein [Nanoarchaeota archaeon]
MAGLEIKQTPGRVTRRVYQLTTVYATDAPSLDVDGQFAYTVVGEGHTSGTDSISIHKHGERAGSAPRTIGVSLTEAVKMGYEAATTAIKNGGRNGKVVRAIADAVRQYAADRAHYKTITSTNGKKFVRDVSAEEVDADTVKEGTLEVMTQSE